jgi:hypothetical protein
LAERVVSSGYDRTCRTAILWLCDRFQRHVDGGLMAPNPYSVAGGKRLSEWEDRSSERKEIVGMSVTDVELIASAGGLERQQRR